MKSASNESFCSGSFKSRWAISKWPEGPHVPAFSRLHCVSRKSRVRVSRIWALLHTNSAVWRMRDHGETLWRVIIQGIGRFIWLCCEPFPDPYPCSYLQDSLCPQNSSSSWWFWHFFQTMRCFTFWTAKSIYRHQSKQQKQNNLKNRQKTWINIPPTHAWQRSTWKGFGITNI